MCLDSNKSLEYIRFFNFRRKLLVIYKKYKDFYRCSCNSELFGYSKLLPNVGLGIE